MPLKTKPNLAFGVIADLQYCDAPLYKNRYYRNSIDKLQKAADELNRHELDFVINLGDVIDHGWEGYDRILPVFNKFKAPVYQVLGNHDYDVDVDKKSKVHSKLGIERYYNFSLSKWRFIVLDGNEISIFANLPGSYHYAIAENWLRAMEEDQLINAHFWNGGIGYEQMNWLQSILRQSDGDNENVIIFCHYPVFPHDKHNLLNNEEILTLIKNYKGVKMWINGHNHKGNYGLFEDIHFVNVKGMVEGEYDLAYCVVKLFDDHIMITGYDSEISARLSFR